MTNLEQIKSELRSLDVEVLLELFYNVSDHIISRDLNDLLYNENPREIVRMMEYGDCLHLHMQYIDRKTQGFTLSFKSGNNLKKPKNPVITRLFGLRPLSLIRF